MDDEMVMGRGVERKANPDIEKMLNFFDLHFSTPAEKAMSRICSFKTERNLQIFGWCLQFKQSYTILFLSAKQSRGNQCNGASRLRKMFQKSSALSILLEMRRSPLQIEFTTFAAKKPQPLCEIWIEKGVGEKRKSVAMSS
jgi:hypothetical protein